MLKVPSYVENLIPYKAGKPIEELAREQGLEQIVKLASNENPLGPSPKAAAAIQQGINQLHRYTDPSCYTLVHALAKKYGQPAGNIFCASGSDAILQYAITAFSEAGDELLTSEGTFMGWYVNVNKLNRRNVTVPLQNYAINLTAIAAAVTEATKIIYLANPNNPTGTMFTSREFSTFLAAVPENVLIVLDEAYTAYAQENPDYPNGINYNNRNLLVVRTFSKTYGLAALRIGIAFGHHGIITQLFKVKLPFEPSSLAQDAALASLEDDEFLRVTLQINRESLRLLRDKFTSLGIPFTQSAANFFMLIFPSAEIATAFNDACLRRGLILRHVTSFGFPEGIRINSGTLPETQFALSVITNAFQETAALFPALGALKEEQKSL